MTAITVVVPTRCAGGHLARVLRSLEDQTLSPEQFEVLVVADGSASDNTDLDTWHDGDRRRVVRQRHSGLAPARNLGVFMAGSPLVLFLDDDEIAEPSLLDEHVRAHAEHNGPTSCVVGSSSWSSDLASTPLLHFLRGVERLPLSYPDVPTESSPDFSHFRARQLSVKRELLARYDVFDETFAPLDDVELGYRLRRVGVKLHHRSVATSTRTTCPTFTEWSEQSMAEGRAIARLAETYPADDMQGHCRVASVLEHWRRHGSEHAAVRARITRLEVEVGTDIDAADPVVAGRLWLAYKACFDLDRAEGIVESQSFARPTVR